ncbi:hypothetical protein J6590_007072 [Homalodisca vitripennis]|nr:hypothetical protein J6590_007072 [Homalodisca vitripennis]
MICVFAETEEMFVVHYVAKRWPPIYQDSSSRKLLPYKGCGRRSIQQMGLETSFSAGALEISRDDVRFGNGIFSSLFCRMATKPPAGLMIILHECLIGFYDSSSTNTI